MGIALASFTMVAISGRLAGQGTDTMHVMFYRSAISVGVIVLILLLTPAGLGQIRTKRFGLHCTRNAIHFVAQYSWLSALMLIPLAQLFAIEFTAPLWVAVLAPLLLGERLTLPRVAAALIGFVGVVIIVRPGTIALSSGTIFALIAALGFATSMIATKKLVRTDAILCILFHMSWMQMVIAGLLVAQNLQVPSQATFIGIMGVALAGLSAHFSLARAFIHADAIIVAPMDFLRLPLIMYVGWVLYGESVERAVLIGAAVVVVANIINVLGERRYKSRPSAD